MATNKIAIRRDTAANWTSNNPTLVAGEQGEESDTGGLKIGDGSTAWTSLGYIIYPNSLRLVLLAEADRPAADILSAGTATTYTDIDFGAYVPTGVAALLLRNTFIWTGDGSVDFKTIYMRKNGSTEAGSFKVHFHRDYHFNAPAGSYYGGSYQLIIDCDSAGVVEYKVDTACELYSTIVGYYI